MNSVAIGAEVSSEFKYSDKEFKAIVKLVNKLTGIYLNDDKKPLTYSRFSKIIRRRRLSGFSDYIALVERGGDEIESEFINSITTNFTSFFREDHHFAFLSQYLKSRTEKTPLKIWSAGCSTGEEPYTIAMTILECRGLPYEISIVATDLDRDVLAKAAAGVYAEDRISGLSPDRKSNFFLKGKGSNIGKVMVKPQLKRLIEFKQLNFMDEWSMSSRFDLIFCRNVMIYFDRITQNRLISKFARAQDKGGRLIIGHSENVGADNPEYRLIGKTIYERK